MRQFNNDPGPISSHRDTASAVEVVHLIADHGLAAAEPHRGLLVDVVADLASATGRAWTVEQDEPMPALERALAVLVRRAPEHRSAAAGRLRSALAA